MFSKVEKLEMLSNCWGYLKRNSSNEAYLWDASYIISYLMIYL